jgi:hypothetical protein
MACLTPRIGLAGQVGEPAEPLNISQWIKGESVEIKPGTNIYVVEIWNTGMKVCREAIPFLRDIQERYRTNGVIVVAVSDEPAAKLRTFVAQASTNINYRVAADNGRRTSLTYMNPVMQHSIPYAFVVGTNGHLLWHGTPMGSLDRIVNLVVSGTYDEEKAKNESLAAFQLAQYLNLVRQGSDRAEAAGQTLLAARTNNVDMLCEMAWLISSTPNLLKRDFALAGQALDQAEKLAPTNAVVGVSRAIWLFESGKQSEGLARATQALAWAESPLQATNIQVTINRMQQRRAAGASKQSNTKPDVTSTNGLSSTN